MVDVVCDLIVTFRFPIKVNHLSLFSFGRCAECVGITFGANTIRSGKNCLNKNGSENGRDCRSVPNRSRAADLLQVFTHFFVHPQSEASEVIAGGEQAVESESEDRSGESAKDQAQQHLPETPSLNG